MTNYNDGNWHGWNGGERPVHPKTVVDIWDATSGTRQVLKSKHVHWSFRGAFRVVREHREPREWWALWSPSGTLSGNFTECSAHEKNDDYYGGRGEIIHVREVIE